MKTTLRLALAATVLALSACSTHAGTGSVYRAAEEVCSAIEIPRSATEPAWGEASCALQHGDFATAASLLEQLADAPGEPASMRALYHLALVRLDPRNPERDVAGAVEALRQYLHFAPNLPSGSAHATEARVILDLAVAASGAQEQSRLLAEQISTLDVRVDSLRDVVRQRDEQIAAQSENLERIRRILSSRGQGR